MSLFRDHPSNKDAKDLVKVDWEVKGTGQEVFLSEGSIVAGCSHQWAEDDDEIGLLMDQERGESVAKLLAQVPRMVRLLRRLNDRGGLGITIHEQISYVLKAAGVE